jgi:hypothetical protein
MSYLKSHDSTKNYLEKNNVIFIKAKKIRIKNKFILFYNNLLFLKTGFISKQFTRGSL